MRKALVNDLVGLAGLVSLGTGLWMINPIYCYIVIGCLAVAYSIIAARG